MSTITCLKELEERKCLENRDIIIFIVNEQKLRYGVKRYYLENITDLKGNESIFRILEIDKYKIAEVYGYKTNIVGDWPESEVDDFPALTRLVKELYIIIEEKDKVYTKYNRFEIMDI